MSESPGSPTNSPVLYLIVCAAPPTQVIGELVGLLQGQGWRVCVIATPRAATWLDIEALAAQAGYTVRSDYKQPGDPDALPRADAVVVAPATFNTINKWAAGISDTFALGILNEALGLKLPITVVPYAKPSLAAHPVFGESLKKLESWGVRVLPNEVIRVRPERKANKPDSTTEFDWRVVAERVSVHPG